MNPRRIVDTNVPKIANGDHSPQASPQCRQACIRELESFFESRRMLVIDDQWHVLKEYQANLYPSNGGLGDRFLQWVLQNLRNANVCVQIHLPPHTGRSFEDFPDDDRLHGFDPADRKWIALARACIRHFNESAPIAEAADKKWRAYEHVLAEHQVVIDFICAAISKPRRRRIRRQRGRNASVDAT
jgi:hypothetical protein